MLDSNPTIPVYEGLRPAWSLSWQLLYHASLHFTYYSRIFF